MDNFFLTEYFDWRLRRSSHVDRVLNRGLGRLGVGFRSRTAQLVDAAVHQAIGYTPAPVHSGISTNIEQRMNMFHLVSQVIAYDVPGDIVELGCNEGHSAVLLQKVIEDAGSDKALHLYDSFAGLPSTAGVDGTTYAGGDLATTQDVVRQNFRCHGLREPVIHPGWFEDTVPAQLPEKVAFAHLDGDLYSSIATSLEGTYPRLSRGAVCLIDDYCDPEVDPDGWNELPGVKKACDEFLADRPERIYYLYSGGFSHGFFRKL